MLTVALERLQHISGHVCVVGSLNIDYVITTERMPRPGETVVGGPLATYPGGKSSNQAACAAQVGAHTTLLGALGSDSAAEFLRSALLEVGVCADCIKTCEGQSGTTVIVVDTNGENSIVYAAGANELLKVEDIIKHQDAIISADVLGLCLESPLEVVIKAAKIAHNHGVRVLLNNSPFNPDLPQELIDCVDVLLVNEHEMARMLSFEKPADIEWCDIDWMSVARAFAEKGFNQVVVTLGSQGSVVLDHGRKERIVPVKVTPVDTTGCGDAFMGCILASLASGYTLAAAAQSASYVAAYAAQSMGAQVSYGTTEEVIRQFS